MSPGGQGTGRSTRPSCGMGGGQRPCRQTALRTRSRSTCLRATRRGSAAVTYEASHERYRSVQKVSPRRERRGGNGPLMLTQAATARRAQLFRTAVFSCAHPGTALGGPGHIPDLSRRPARPGDLSRRSARPGPADRAFRWLGGRQTLAGRQAPPGHSQMAPGHGMTAKSCGNCRPRPAGRGSPGYPGQGPDQAAFARRILRRRSEARSSSLRPPQVPYFSGRDTA